MTPEVPSVKRRSCTCSDKLRSASPCACIKQKKKIKIEDSRVNKWLDTIKVYLDEECHVHEENCPKRSLAKHDTSLHDAVRKNDVEIVKLLIEKKACIASKSKYDLTPLHVAVYGGHLKIAEILLNHEASVDCKCTLLECTPLDLAILACRPEMVKLFLSHDGINNSEKLYNWKLSRLFRRTENYNIMNVYLLVWYLDRWNKNRKTSLLKAAEASMAHYKTLVAHLADNVCLISSEVTVILREFTHLAVGMGFDEVVEDLLIWGADIGIIDYRAYASHIPGITLLHTAVKHNRNDIAKLLIDNGADVNAEDGAKNSPIVCAFKNNNVKIIELLLKNGADKNDLLRTAFQISRNCETIEKLLKNGCNVNCRDNLQQTPLHLVAREAKCINGIFDSDLPISQFWDLKKYPEEGTNNSVKMIKLLLSNGADLDARDNSCCTPLHVAAKYGNFEAVEALLEYYGEDNGAVANIDAIGELRATALILAAEKGHEKVVKILLKFGADVDFKREDGKTALIRATEAGHEKVVGVLLEYNADTEATTYDGLTAVDIVFKNLLTFHFATSTKLIMLLLNSGADVNAVNLLDSSMVRVMFFNVFVFVNELIVKMKAANLYVDEKKFESIINSKKSRYFRKICEGEVEELKREKIAESNVSLYDILTKNTNRLAIICRNGQIVGALESEYYKESFPIYSCMIENNFKKARKRAVLLDRASCSFNSLIGYAFLDGLSAHILRYLSNKDLKKLEEASAF